MARGRGPEPINDIDDCLFTAIKYVEVIFFKKKKEF